MSSSSLLRTMRLQAPLRMQVRSFQSYRPLMVGKETAQADDARKAEIEKAKQEQLKDGEFKDSLASESESVLKADRGELKADKSTISELQKESAKAAEREKKQGK